MSFHLKLIVHLILYFFTILVIGLVRDAVYFHFIAVGAIASTCMMMDASGGYYNSSSSGTVGAICGFPSTSEALEEASSLRFLEPKGLPNADSPVQLLEIPPQAEPSVSAEGPAPGQYRPPSPLRAPDPDADASAALNEEGVSVCRNRSLEASLQARIRAIEKKGNPFIWWDGSYGASVKESLISLKNQNEYDWQIEFESQELLLRELREEISSLVKNLLPSEIRNKADEDIFYYVSEISDNLKQCFRDNFPQSFRDRDIFEVKELNEIIKDLKQNGPASSTFRSIVQDLI